MWMLLVKYVGAVGECGWVKYVGAEYPSSIPKWAPVGPIRGPFGAQLCPTGAQPGPTWNAAWVGG